MFPKKGKIAKYSPAFWVNLQETRRLQKITYLDMKAMHWDLHSILLRSYKPELPPIMAGLPKYKSNEKR